MSKNEAELTPRVMYSDLSGKHYFVKSFYKDGRAKDKYDITEFITAYAERQSLLARIDESNGYCDYGHYHDHKNDLAMLPSERNSELQAQLTTNKSKEK